MSAEKKWEWPWTHEEFEEWSRKQQWIFAKTLASNPHFYCLKRNQNPKMFELAVLHIREFGYQQRWWGTEYTQYEADGHHFWTMGDPLETTILINRKTDAQAKEDARTGKGGK